MKNFLLSPDPAEGSGSSSDVVANNPPTAAPGTPPPPAAAAVLSGTVTEDTAQLKDELETERKLRKQREIEVSELQDKYHALKSAGVAAPAPQPKPSPWTFWG